ncbi:hypothetical protein B0H15DRAFT_957595 [Mycena belliarum]|uniref:Uncharacterized protein n=1 Tax=Mycena belliarum TaxID=1033014 RepID=A0AAD6TP39_9AGAR|nr:hypothetical protein B0H15DRAFT_957595 [Mycena belliae]
MPRNKHSKSSSKENPHRSESRPKRRPKNTPRAPPLQDHNTGGTSTPPLEDGARVRELEGKSCSGSRPTRTDNTAAALLRETQAQLRTTEARLQEQRATEQGPTTRSQGRDNSRIGVLSRLSDVTMREIRTRMGFDRSKWRALRSCVRDCLRAARLNWDADWRSQSTTKRGYAYNAIEDDFPELRRFEGQWAVNRIAKDVWDNRKTYINCVDNPSTYIGRRAAQRQRGRGSIDTSSRHSSSPLPTPPSQPDSPNRSPTPGPSHAPPRPRPRVIRSPSSSPDSGDDLMKFSDHQSSGEEDEDGGEEDEDDHQHGKRHARSSGGSSSKRRRH